jgi:phosphatidylethanolamine/phosphatidyl-N-methylethanolamine N-methyltransferase
MRESPGPAIGAAGGPGDGRSGGKGPQLQWRGGEIAVIVVSELYPYRLGTMQNSAKVKPFEDELRFLRRLIVRPRKLGAIAPSSPALARAVAAQVDAERSGPVLELGPGTGVMTRALLESGIVPGRLTVIEYDRDFARLIGVRFPGVHVISGDAFDLDRTLNGHALEPLAAVVSGIPLLNYPPERRLKLISAALDRLEPGAPFVQFSYGFHPPVSSRPGMNVSCAAFVLMNLPPAHVWVYRRD